MVAFKGAAQVWSAGVGAEGWEGGPECPQPASAEQGGEHTDRMSTKDLEELISEAPSLSHRCCWRQISWWPLYLDPRKAGATCPGGPGRYGGGEPATPVCRLTLCPFLGGSGPSTQVDLD